MAGNKLGGAKSRDTIVYLYGYGHYSRIGRLGGLKSRGGGFAYDPELARIAGSKGGKASKRGPSKRKCQVKDCDNRHKAMGFCSSHYYASKAGRI